MQDFLITLENDEGEMFQVEHRCRDFGSASEWANAEFPEHSIVSIKKAKGL